MMSMPEMPEMPWVTGMMRMRVPGRERVRMGMGMPSHLRHSRRRRYSGMRMRMGMPSHLWHSHRHRYSSMTGMTPHSTLSPPSPVSSPSPPSSSPPPSPPLHPLMGEGRCVSETMAFHNANHQRCVIHVRMLNPVIPHSSDMPAIRQHFRGIEMLEFVLVLYQREVSKPSIAILSTKI